MTLEEELAAIRAENELLKAARDKRAQQPVGVFFKVSPKGAMSLYGLQRYPVTLYKDQWRALLQKAAEIEEFLTAHDGELKAKEKSE